MFRFVTLHATQVSSAGCSEMHRVRYNRLSGAISYPWCEGTALPFPNAILLHSSVNYGSVSAIFLNQRILYQASSWCGKHLIWFVDSIDDSEAVQEEEHNSSCLEVFGTTPLSLFSLFVLLWLQVDSWINRKSSVWLRLLRLQISYSLEYLNHESCLMHDFTLVCIAVTGIWDL
jgi:hypothetical protein